MALPVVNPGVGVDDTQVVPLDVRMFPLELGATKVGEEVPLPRTTAFAVSVVRPVPPLATDRVPVVPATIGSPVALVNVPDDGVPKTPPLTRGAPVLPTFTANAVATPVPSPDTPVEIGNPVAFVNVADDGVPSAGVTRVGLVAKTSDPVPVSSVTALRKFVLDGVPKKVATPVANPDTPVEIGSPVALVSVPLAGVPSAGVTRVGLFDSTTLPVPVDVVTPVPPLATASVPALMFAALNAVKFEPSP